MTTLRLELPAEKHEKQWQTIIEEFESLGEAIIPYALKLETENYEVYLEKTMDFHLNRNVPDNFVPASLYFLMADGSDKILGAVSIRHRLNAYLLERGGHIGYGIAPSERRKSYATEILALALEKCKDLGIEKALVTCDKSNLGSSKTILKNFGMLENEVVEESGNIVERYWAGIKTNY